MPKRLDRLAPMLHHREQLEKLLTLEPNKTPERWRAFSDELVQIARQALALAMSLEAQRAPKATSVEQFIKMVAGLPDLAPKRESEVEAETEEA